MSHRSAYSCIISWGRKATDRFSKFVSCGRQFESFNNWIKIIQIIYLEVNKPSSEGAKLIPYFTQELEEELPAGPDAYIPWIVSCGISCEVCCEGLHHLVWYGSLVIIIMLPSWIRLIQCPVTWDPVSLCIDCRPDGRSPFPVFLISALWLLKITWPTKYEEKFQRMTITPGPKVALASPPGVVSCSGSRSRFTRLDRCSFLRAHG